MGDMIPGICLKKKYCIITKNEVKKGNRIFSSQTSVFRRIKTKISLKLNHKTYKWRSKTIKMSNTIREQTSLSNIVDECMILNAKIQHVSLLKISKYSRLNIWRMALVCFLKSYRFICKLLNTIIFYTLFFIVKTLCKGSNVRFWNTMGEFIWKELFIIQLELKVLE